MSIASSLLLMAAAAAGEPAIDCENAMTQTDMNICAAQDYDEADKLLNEQWTETAADMKQRDAQWGDSYGDDRPTYFDQLLASQRAWLTYRDEQCAMEGYEYRGGSMEPLIVSSCLAEMTDLRTEYLYGLSHSDK